VKNWRIIGQKFGFRHYDDITDPSVSFGDRQLSKFVVINTNKQPRLYALTFQWNISDYSSTLKMEAVRSFETSVNFYQPTWRHIRDDSALHYYCCLFGVWSLNSRMKAKMRESPHIGSRGGQPLTTTWVQMLPYSHLQATNSAPCKRPEIFTTPKWDWQLLHEVL
jgi:hypothetical protein